MNAEAVMALNAIGHTLTTLGHQIVALTNGLSEVEPTPAVTLREHYSQSAKDARQEPVLAMFDGHDDSLPWVGEGSVSSVALANGYTTSGLGGLLMPNGLLEWADAGHARVRITEKGRIRLREIRARRAA